MERLFVATLNMSVTASVVIAVVMAVRLILKNFPRKFSYYLWGIVLIRLLFPVLPTAGFGLTSDIKFIKLQEEVVTEGKSNQWDADGKQSKVSDKGIDEGGYDGVILQKDVLTHVSAINAKDNIEDAAESNMRKTGENVLEVAAYVWFAGTLLLLSYGIGSYILLKYKYKELCQRGDTIVISDRVKAPFAAGVFHTIMFLPSGLSREQQSLVIAHERIHIKRKDLFVKALFFLVLSIHWFNPLVWISFYLMEQDMEVSCDEAVLEKAGTEQKKLYARTLLLFAHSSGVINSCPVAFGENSTKTRIKHAVKLKKATPWAIVVGAVVVVLTAGLLLVNRTEGKTEVANPADIREMHEEIQFQTEEIKKPQETEEAEEAEETEGLAQEEEMKELQAAEEKIEKDDIKLVAHLQEEETDAYENILRNKEGIYNEFGIFYQMPIPGAKVSEVYGNRVHPVTGEEHIHSGVDYVAEKGTAVLAAAEGTVYETGFDAMAGNYVILLHGNGEMTYYANCDTILTEVSKEVKVGEQIATVGSTGVATGAHLHFALSYQGKYIEPIISEGNSSILTCD